MNIIGITGRKYHGKDTVADYLVSEYGFTKISLADPLKEVCKILFGFSIRQLYGDLKEEIDPRWGKSPRQILQFVGTELFRDHIDKLFPGIGENFWVHITIQKIEKILEINPEAKFVIPDIRFPNEIELLKKTFHREIFHISFWRIVRPSVETNSHSSHASEALVDTLAVDREILNDSSLEDLYKKIDIRSFG